MDWRADISRRQLSSILLLLIFILFCKGDIKNDVVSITNYNNATVHIYQDLTTLNQKINVINGTFNDIIPLIVSNAETYVVLYTYNYEELKEKAIRVHVTSANASGNFPVLFVVKQQLGILSWQIPLFADNRVAFYSVSRTLCPVRDYFSSTTVAILPQQTISVDISSASSTPVAVNLKLDFEDTFYIGVDQLISVTASPSEPRYFKVLFPNDTNNLLVKVSATDDICAVVSIQDAKCPVFDLDRTVQFNGTYQTMLKKAAIATNRRGFSNGFFIVLVVKSDDEACTGIKVKGANNTTRIKNFTVEVVPTISEEQYWIATFGVLGMFLLFYLFAVIVAIFYCIRGSGEDQLLRQAEACAFVNPGPLDNCSYGAITPSSSFDASLSYNRNRAIVESTPLLQNAASTSVDNADSDSSLDETDIDLLPDADSEKEIVRLKTCLYVSDLARKKCKTLHKKTRMYTWNVMTIAILYALPVIQLVLTYQKAVNTTGNQDVCYYNFLCAHPRGYFYDFNHVYSNIGYFLLGFLFLSLVWRRDLMYKKLVELNPNIEKMYGVPHHFGLFYAMAVALMMEGLLSACYHVCPNYTNFQFDTSFMYVIAGLCMLKLYQVRHPDINADAYGASFAFAIVILLALIGVLYGELIYWIVFTAGHILFCLALSVQFYYMGRWKLNLGVFKRLYLQFKNDVLSSHCMCKPLYMDRMILLVLANATNWAVATFGFLQQPKDFASYLLSILMVNLLLYLAFYIIMKLRHGEKFLFLPKIYIVLSAVCWTASLYFFIARKSISWELLPAQSRQKNRPCQILNFYDDHDIWHFLSAASMFFSFMILLTMDDDLMFTPRTKIPVF